MGMGAAYLCSLLAMDTTWLEEALYGPDLSGSAPNTQPPSPSSSEGGSISDPTHILVPVTFIPTPRSEAGAQTTWETPSVEVERQTDTRDAGAQTNTERTPSVDMRPAASTVEQQTDTLASEAPSTAMDAPTSVANVEQQSNTAAFEAPAATDAYTQTALPVQPPSPSSSEGGSISAPSYVLVPVTSPRTPRSEAAAQTASEAPPTASAEQQTDTSDAGAQTATSEATSVAVRPPASTVEQQTDTPQDWVHPWLGTTISEAAADSEASSVADASEFDVWPAASMEALLNVAAVDVTLEAAEALMSPDSKAAAYKASSIPLSSHAVAHSEPNPPFVVSPPSISRTSGSPSAAPPSPSRPSEPPTWAPSRDDAPSAAPPSQPPSEVQVRGPSPRATPHPPLAWAWDSADG